MGLKTKIITKIPRSVKNRLKDTRLNYYRILILEFQRKYSAPRFYGQTAEDALLRMFLPEKDGFYVDIGAGRPIRGSNTFVFYKRGWTGICVDPISINVRLLRVFRRSDKILESLVGSVESSIDFWEFEPYEFSTADATVAKEVEKYKGVRLLQFSRKSVIPLSKIAPKIVPHEPALLSIDVEGFDLEVLKSNDWAVFRPRVICVEEWESTLNESLSSEVEKFLTGQNYERRAWTGLSSIFVEKSFLNSKRDS